MKRIPVALAATAAAAFLGGCGTAAPVTASSKAPAATQAAPGKLPGCTTAVAAVRQVASGAGIDLRAGSTDGRTVSSDDAARWASQLGQAGKIANQYNAGPGAGRQLASDLLRAQEAATLLSLDAGRSPDSDAKALAAALQSVSGDC
jgi:hypothetical protein